MEGLRAADVVVAQALRFAVGAKIFCPDRAKIRNVQITRLAPGDSRDSDVLSLG